MAPAIEPTPGYARPSTIAVAALALLFVCAAPRAWPMDGARIAVGATTAADQQSGIYITTPEGEEFQELMVHGAGSGDPAWSHDGRSIAFSHSPDGWEGGIYVADRNGRNLRQVSGWIGDFAPTWSPRDDAIAFYSSRLGRDSLGIYVVDLIGGAEARITDAETHSRSPTWRPAGDVIAYTLRDAGGSHIHTMDSEGRSLGPLTDRRGSDKEPTWHPRGTAMAYVSWEDFVNNDIYTMNADGTGMRRLTTHVSEDRDPVWSPDGTQILFQSYRDGDPRLYIMDLDGRIVRRLTDNKWAQFRSIRGASWFDPDVPRSVSPVGRRAVLWGWMKRLGVANP